MRYTYLGSRDTDPALKGMQCDPVRRPDGKCIIAGLRPAVAAGTVIEHNGVRIVIVKGITQRSMASALVMDEAGTRHVVLRRRLRVNK